MRLNEALVFGSLALVFAIFAVTLLIGKRYTLSGISGIITVVFVCLSAYIWHLALGDNGKNQAWLGFGQYPAALIILIFLAAAGLLCIATGLIRIAKKTRP